MFRTILIVLATALAFGGTWLSYQIPVRADMKRWAQVLLGLSFFFLLFFTVIRFIDDYAWWTVPALSFIAIYFYGFRRLNEINRLIARGRPDPWLTKVAAASQPTTGAPVTNATFQHHYENDGDPGPDEPPYYDSDLLFGGSDDPPPRRFFDDFRVADEADLKDFGVNELNLDRLDDFIFTGRHGYLVHDYSQDKAPCDVMTISPGMSIADLIDAANAHTCTHEEDNHGSDTGEEDLPAVPGQPAR